MEPHVIQWDLQGRRDSEARMTPAQDTQPPLSGIKLCGREERGGLSSEPLMYKKNYYMSGPTGPETVLPR